MNYLRIKNWENYQHYKDRTVIWIKFYMCLLDDSEFRMLDDASKKLLPLLLLCAGVYRNRIPNDEKVIRKRLTLTRKIDLKPLIISGFLIPVASTVIESRYPESIERREEKKREYKKGDKKVFGGMEAHFKTGFLSEKRGTNNPISHINKAEVDIVAQLLAKLPEEIDPKHTGREFWRFIKDKDGSKEFRFAIENLGDDFVRQGKPKPKQKGHTDYERFVEKYGE